MCIQYNYVKFVETVSSNCYSVVASKDLITKHAICLRSYYLSFDLCKFVLLLSEIMLVSNDFIFIYENNRV